MLPRTPEPTPEHVAAPADHPAVAFTDPRQVLARELPLVERIVGSIARRNGLFGDDADDFGSFVRAKLVADDYAVLRKFRRGSRLATFLHTVIANLFHDFWNERWGKWRPSAPASRLGVWAVRLETLVVRDGCRWGEAITVVRSSVRDAPGEREMFAFLSALPGRVNSRKTSSLEPDAVPSTTRADEEVERAEAEAQRAELLRALESCFSTLLAEDRLIMRMRFWDGCTVAEIARTLSIEQKSLYRRITAVLARLATQLRGAGFCEADVCKLVDDALPWDPRRGEV